jgi:hypothetical protein
MSHEQFTHQTVLHVFAALVFGEMPVPTFQQWVFTTPDIADVLSYDVYVRLLDVEYGLSSAKQDVIDIVGSVQMWQPDQLLRTHIQSILCGLLHRTIPVKVGCEQLAWWRRYGALWIPPIFEGIASELDNVPAPTTYKLWNARALATKLAQVQSIVSSYETLASIEAEKLLKTEYGSSSCEQ